MTYWHNVFAVTLRGFRGCGGWSLAEQATLGARLLNDDLQITVARPSRQQQLSCRGDSTQCPEFLFFKGPFAVVTCCQCGFVSPSFSSPRFQVTSRSLLPIARGASGCHVYPALQSFFPECRLLEGIAKSRYIPALQKSSATPEKPSSQNILGSLLG